MTREDALALVVVTLPLLLCAAAAEGRARDQPVELVQARAEVPEDELLDVGIVVFRTGIPAESEDPAIEQELAERGIFREVRRGEARYFAVRLAGTLQLSGHWGAVRVVPATTDAVDVTVTATILESSGRKMVLEVEARDAAGRKWVRQRYKRLADPRGYGEQQEGERVLPFASLYNEIANDLLKARRRLDADEVRELRRISFLRFAADLAPTSFGDYLRRDSRGRYRLAGLPAEDDPMAQRIAQVRERDYLLVDTLHEQYGTFFGEMELPYSQWRAYSYEEEVALAKLRRQARMQKIVGAIAILGGVLADSDSNAGRAARDAAVIGGTMAIQAGIAKSQEAKIHREAIQELAASFDSEVAPMVVEVEGRTLRLTGSAETRYAEWRELLREIMATETGIPLDPDAAAGLASEGTPER